MRRRYCAQDRVNFKNAAGGKTYHQVKTERGQAAADRILRQVQQHSRGLLLRGLTAALNADDSQNFFFRLCEMA